ncbi:VTT domain-containing protein [Cecembia calidifontis]|uniref:SNARE associated Golgi protein n=1 Tax=Cecembia calidifontis TaxID=1187080 RepID=A0A4Q7P738_9BACT|nr:VTT domain-containing protein [Cecembia calidifontis]RZS95854.1 SNARE associated Golgi protein [Cecembia calidifontis]
MADGNSRADRLSFLIKNLAKGFLYLGVLVVLFFLIRQYFSEQERLEWFGAIYNNPYLVMTVFVGSEVLFGIIPPEIFMLWSLETGWIGPYFLSIGLLSVISYAAGYFNFNLGLIVNHRINFLQSKNRYIQKYMSLFSRYGAFLVLVASLTPLPFSLIALLGGAAGLEKRKYLGYSLLRILRFFAYAYVLWLIQR